MPSGFCGALRQNVLKAKAIMDQFHVIQRANLMIAQVRRRRSDKVHERHGKASDPADKYRKLLICTLENLPINLGEWLQLILERDPELGVVYAIK